LAAGLRIYGDNSFYYGTAADNGTYGYYAGEKIPGEPLRYRDDG
jgi:hypothetical protein